MFGSLKKTKIFIILCVILCVASYSAAYAQQAPQTQVTAQTSPSSTEKDTDMDGLTDTAEVQIYKTNPQIADSDGDRVIDSQEIIDKTNPNDSQSNGSLNVLNKNKNLLKKLNPTMWYIARASGIAAFITFTLVVCMGLLMSTKTLLKFKFMLPYQALEIHSFTASWIALSLVILHFTSLMLDNNIKLSLFEALVPFAYNKDISSLAGVNFRMPLALGIIAFYLGIVLVVTSRLRNKVFSIKTWRKLHYLSFAFYVSFVAHAYFSGSDSQEPWMIAIYVISISLVSVLVFVRIFLKRVMMPKSKPVVKQDTSTQTV